MKKTLAAVAVLGAFAGSALAADVTLYGRIDTGLAYTGTDYDGLAEDTNVGEMTTGFSTGSRWGIKGVEELGNGLKVGFVLENGFDSDDGELGQGGLLFGREAIVSLSGDFGTVYAGRMATLVSDSGSIGFLGDASVFGNSYGYASMKGSTGSAFARFDNALAYVSPNFAGFDARVMIASDTDRDTGKEYDGDNKRYAAIGLKYAAGGLTAMLAVDTTMYDNDVAAAGDYDDAYTVTLGGNYDFEVAKVFFKATYFDNAVGVMDSFDLGVGDIAVKGYGLELGTKIPALGGNVLASVGYRDAEEVDGDLEFTRLNVSVGYTYAFSKRTNVYGAINYLQEEGDDGVDSYTPSAYQVGIGLVHKF